MNILSMLSILVAESGLRKVKMRKMFKMLKKIICQNPSGLLGASTVSQTARAAIYMIQIIRIGVIEEYAIRLLTRETDRGLHDRPLTPPRRRGGFASTALPTGESEEDAERFACTL
jgi:hypothetical protein